MKKGVLILILSLFTIILNAQDPLSTNKRANIINTNPALVGSVSEFGVDAYYRNQWPSFPSNPVTYSLGSNYNLNDKLGFGLSIVRDEIGFIKTNSVKTNINYAITKGDLKIVLGTNLGWRNAQYNWSKLKYEDQINPSQGFTGVPAEKFETKPANSLSLDVGATGYYKGFLLGASAYQVNQPNVSLFANEENVLDIRYVANLGYHKNWGSWSVGALETYQQQAKHSVLETQVYGQFKFVKLGLGNRMSFGEFSNRDWLTASLGVQFDKFSVSYGYETIPSNIQDLHAHGASVSWFIKGLKKDDGLSRLMQVMM